MKINKKEIIKELEKKEKKAKSKRQKTIVLYAYDLLENIDADYLEPKTLKKELLNGAENFKQYSYCGNALIYDADILERLPKTHEKFFNKIGSTYLLDIQGRYLYDAFTMIYCILCKY